MFRVRCGFVCFNVGPRLALGIFPSRLVLVCVRRWSSPACAVVSLLHVFGWCLVLVVVLRLGFGLVRWFRIVFSLSLAACWSTQAKIGEFA